MIQNDQVNATEESTLEVDAADGVLANDTSPNGPLTVVEGLYRTTGGGQIYFFLTAPTTTSRRRDFPAPTPSSTRRLITAATSPEPPR